MLKISDLHAGYGAIKALKGVTLAVGQGEIVALLGSNGAGKSTILKVISGVLKPTGGKLQIDGTLIKNTSTEQIVKMGVVQVPEGRRVFPGLTVMENLKMGAYTRRNKGEVKSDLEMVMDYFPILRQRQNQLAGSLSGGQQQMLVIGRALMANPQILLLDEPSLGLAPIITYEIFSILRSINGDGVTIFMVEQNANMALSLATRGYVLQNGKVAMQGLSTELQSKDEIIHSYLG